MLYDREFAFTKSPNENFCITKSIDIMLTPLQPSLCLYPRHFLEMVNESHQTTLHSGGIRSSVVVKGFRSRKYTKLVKALLQDRQDTLGVSLVGVSTKTMKERIDKYYTQEFRREGNNPGRRSRMACCKTPPYK